MFIIVKENVYFSTEMQDSKLSNACECILCKCVCLNLEGLDVMRDRSSGHRHDRVCTAVIKENFHFVGIKDGAWKKKGGARLDHVAKIKPRECVAEPKCFTRTERVLLTRLSLGYCRARERLKAWIPPPWVKKNGVNSTTRMKQNMTYYWPIKTPNTEVYRIVHSQQSMEGPDTITGLTLETLWILYFLKTNLATFKICSLGQYFYRLLSANPFIVSGPSINTLWFQLLDWSQRGRSLGFDGTKVLPSLLENFHIYRYIVFTFYVSKYTLCIPIYMEVFWQWSMCKFIAILVHATNKAAIFVFFSICM